MHIADIRTGMEEIDRGDCLRLLAMHSPAVGRLALIIDGDPMIFPVNYGLVEDRVVLRSGEGSKLQAALGVHRVAFEIDDADEEAHGWSVVVTGRCQAVTSTTQLMILRGARLDTYAGGDKSTWIMIEPDTITGRRVPAIRSWHW